MATTFGGPARRNPNLFPEEQIFTKYSKGQETFATFWPIWGVPKHFFAFWGSFSSFWGPIDPVSKKDNPVRARTTLYFEDTFATGCTGLQGTG